MLSGTRLFDGDTPDAIITKHLVDGAILPAKWPIWAPDGINTVLEKALDKDPANRYEDSNTFASALEALAERSVKSKAPHRKTVSPQQRRHKPRQAEIGQGRLKVKVQSPTQKKSNRRVSASDHSPSIVRKTTQIAGIGLLLIAVILIWLAVSTSFKPTAASTAQTTAAVVLVPTVKTLQWSSPPPMTIDTTKQYFAIVQMAKGGEFEIQLYSDKAPITVNNFVFLANQGFYNGTTFHRVIDGFMAQGGDPTGTGTGGPGYQFVNEKNDLAFDKAGVVAMANAGPDTNGSQFFITFGPVQLNESDYTIFGQVISGMDVVNGITRRDPTSNPTFTGDVMASVTITMR